MTFWRFAPPDYATGLPLTGNYNTWLLLLSVLIACLAGLAALLIVNRIIASTDRKARQYWLVAGASAMGCGIWAMHFSGMLAFYLPIPVSYGVGVTLLSLVPAILGSGAAIYFMAHTELGWKRLQLGALLMAVGIGTMHYTGMEAMHMEGIMRYDFKLFCLSIIVADLLAMAAIYIRFVLGLRLNLPMYWILPLAAIVMGNAVSGMHYTAMAAVQFYPGPGHSASGVVFSNLAMGTVISGFSVLILTLTMLAALVDRRIAAAEHSKRYQEARANTILNTTADGILALDMDGKILSANTSAGKMFGYNTNEFVGKALSQYVQEFTLPAKASGAESIPDFDRSLREFAGRRADGKLFPVEISMNTVSEPGTASESGTVITVVSLRDMSERQRARDTIRKTEERLSIIARATTDAIWDWDLITDAVWWNEGIETLFGYSIDKLEPDSRSWTRRIHPEDRERILKNIHEAIQSTRKDWTAEYRFLRRNGSIAHVVDRGFVIRDKAGKPVRMVGGMTDITERKNAESEIKYLAYYDGLTKLPNRTLLQDRLQQAIATSERTGRYGGLIFIDIDNFKKLNDTLGHDVGDHYLQQVSLRLCGCVRESDTVARLGGDEFVIVLANLSADANEASASVELVGEKILAAFHQPILLDGYEHHSTPSIGITLFGKDKMVVDELLKQADIAMYQAKADGGDAARFFDPQMQARINTRAELEVEMRKALKESEFILYYQPQIGADGRVKAAEALVRWMHPTRGMVPPLQFISVAEETGQIIPLGEWIVETACRQLVSWEGQPETANLDLTVNVSARQFRHPDFVDRVIAILHETGADPRRLKLELTESVLVSDMEDTISRMTALKALGVGFLLDDFGTGYSSLYYLKRLPLNYLKIDRSFVTDVLTNMNDAAIIRTIIALAQALGLGVVAEGVETEGQREFLASLGCHNYQGYLFSKPIPIGEFEDLLRRYNENTEEKYWNKNKN